MTLFNGLMGGAAVLAAALHVAGDGMLAWYALFALAALGLLIVVVNAVHLADRLAARLGEGWLRSVRGRCRLCGTRSVAWAGITTCPTCDHLPAGIHRFAEIG